MPRGKPTLDRDGILDAALALVDREGADALTIRDVARELGVGTMSLYYHLPDKDALLEGVAERVLGDVDLPRGGDWVERLRRATEGVRRAERRHPNALPLLLARHFTSPEALRPFEYILRTLREAGFPPREAFFGFRTLTVLAAGSVLMEPVGSLSGSGEDARADIGRLFAALPEQEFPYLIEAAGQGAKVGAEEEFAASLDLALTGLRVRLASLGDRPDATGLAAPAG